LQELNVDFTWRNYDKEPLSRAELEKLIGTRDLTPFINPRSTPYRELGLKDKKIGKAKAISLMLEDMNLLKRPLVVKGARYIFGLDEAAYREL
jgi:arsenate reductase